MSTPVLIGVGGTGQMVLAAYLRLAEMAGFTPATFYVVDSDTEGPLGRVLATLKGRVKQTVGGKEPPLRWMIDPFPTTNAERKTFGTLFGNLAGDRREIFNCLFSEDAERTPIRTGMYGRPAIGATCIRYKFLQDDDDMKDLRNALRGGEKHVILVGSCFGGTGSGGVPMLAAELARWNNNEPGYSLRVDAVIFLPWFRLIPPEGGVKTSEVSLHEYLNANFEPNAAAGIYYFREKLRQHVETIFLLGVQDPSQVNRTSSESAQGEIPHILNLAAALLVQNHFAGALSPPRGIAGYWYDDTGGLNPGNLLVHREGSAPLSLMQVVHRAYIRSHWLGILSKFFNRFTKLPQSHQPIFIKAAVDILKGSTLTDNQVTTAIAEYFGKQQAQTSENIDWIKKMNNAHFFPFPEGKERVLSDLYDEKVKEPLMAVQGWCDDRHVVAQFPKKDLRTPEAFAEKFSSLFLSNLTQDLNL